MLKPQAKAWAEYTHQGRPPGPFHPDLFPMDLTPLHTSQYKHIQGLVPPFAVTPDLEKYRARRKLLTPLTPAEETYSDQELYERVNRMHMRMSQNPRAFYAKADRVNEVLLTANSIVDNNHELLERLCRYYEPVNGAMLQSPELLCEDPLAVSALADVLLAEEATTAGWPETEDEWQERKRDIEQIVKNQDNENIMIMLPRVVDILLIRELYWQAELGTLVGHRALDDLDQVIEGYQETAESTA